MSHPSSRERQPVATACLVLAQYAFFFAVYALASRGSGAAVRVVALGALSADSPAPLALLTYAFLHADILHLSSNMQLVWLFGSAVEAAVGPWRLLALFASSAAVAGAAEVAMVRLTLPGGGAMVIGASGAAAALAGIFAVRFHRSRVRLGGTKLRIPAVALLAAAIVADATNLAARASHGDAASGSAVWAHLAGMVFGLAYAQATGLYRQGQIEFLTEYALNEAAQHRPARAAELWEQVSRLDPSSTDTRLRRCEALAAAGEAATAHEGYVTQLTVALASRDDDAAASALVSLEAHLPGRDPTPAMLADLAGAMARLGRHAEAADLWLRSSDARPGAAEADSCRVKAASTLLRHVGDAARAEAALRHVVDKGVDAAAQAEARRLLASTRPPDANA
jgi:membrane associated rhomboid family serine protease